MNAIEVLHKAASKVKYQHLISILEAQADFPYAIIKGEVLSCQAYGAPGKRQSGDIDVLVDKRDVRALEKLLTANGFTTAKLSRQEQIVARAFSHQMAPYRKELPMATLEVDINYDIVWGEWQGARPDIREILSRRETVEVYGQAVPALTAQNAFIQLCLHHYKDMNSLFHLAEHNPITKKAFQDVAGFWQRQKGKMDLQTLADWVKQYELEPYFYYIAYWTDFVCQIPDLAAWAAQLKNEKGLALLNCFGLTEEERKEWPVPMEQRLDFEGLHQLVQQMMTEADRKKHDQNQRIFSSL